MIQHQTHSLSLRTEVFEVLEVVEVLGPSESERQLVSRLSPGPTFTLCPLGSTQPYIDVGPMEVLG